MRDWLDFYDLAAPEAPGCPNGALNGALRTSAIQFCEQSLVWKYTHPAIAVVAGTQEYPFAPPAQAVVHTILHARFNDEALGARSGEYDIPIWDWRKQVGTPEYVFGGIAGTLTLVPMPDLAGTLTLDVALKPSHDSDGLDDAIFNEYRQAIVHGALAKLMMSPRKPYSNAQLAAFHHQQFLIQTGSAGTQAARNHTRAPLRTTISRRH